MSRINEMLKNIGSNKKGNYHYVIWHAKKQRKRGRNPSAQFITENGEVIKEPRKALRLAEPAKIHADVRRIGSNQRFNERMQRASRGEDIYAF